MGKEILMVCFNCTHFAIEPGVLDAEHLEIARRRGGMADIPTHYGKCTLVGEGKITTMECDVLDEERNPRFEPVPED